VLGQDNRPKLRGSLLRNSFRYASKRDWPELARDLKPVYTAPSAQAALDHFAEFSDKWENVTLQSFACGTDAWAEFTLFLSFDVKIRKIICTTNPIESINARLRRAVNPAATSPTRPPRSDASTWP
jgi:putative transposase